MTSTVAFPTELRQAADEIGMLTAPERARLLLQAATVLDNLDGNSSRKPTHALREMAGLIHVLTASEVAGAMRNAAYLIAVGELAAINPS